MWLWRNPVLARELELISRNWRVPLVLGACAALAGGATLLYLAAAGAATPGGLPARTGAQLFSYLTTLQLILVVLVAPGLTAGALSGERERQTLEPLWQTGLPAGALVLGKLGAALAYLLLQLLTVAPAMGILFLLGGVGYRPMAMAYAVCLATGLLLAALGLCVSALSARTQAAAAAAYALTAGLVAGTALPVWLAGGALAAWGVRAPVFQAAAALNPVAALAATTGGPVFTPILAALLGPAAGATRAVASGAGGGENLAAAFGGGVVPPGYAALPSGSGSAAAGLLGPFPPVAHGYLAFAGAATLVLIVVAALVVRPPAGRGLRAGLGLGRRPARVGAAAGAGGGGGNG